MIDFNYFNKVYFSSDTNLFRGGISSFQIKVRAFFDENEINDNLFVFISKSMKQIKLYYENDNGTWLAIYRIRKGKFYIPFFESENQESSLTKDELKWIIYGIKSNKIEKVEK